MQLFKGEVRLANPASSQALHWNNHKQIADQTEHNTTKNPNWWDANQLAMYNRGRDSNSGHPGCESNALTTRPRCLPWSTKLSQTPKPFSSKVQTWHGALFKT